MDLSNDELTFRAFGVLIADHFWIFVGFMVFYLDELKLLLSHLVNTKNESIDPFTACGSVSEWSLSSLELLEAFHGCLHFIRSFYIY